MQRTASPGFRYFKCDECNHEWMTPSRDVDSPSGEDCVCGVWVHARPATTEEFDRLRMRTSTFNSDIAATAIIKSAESDMEVDRLKGLIRKVIAGDWSVTELQEAIGQ